MSGNSDGQKITFNVIKQRLGDMLYKVTAQKFEDPGAAGSAPAPCWQLLASAAPLFQLPAVCCSLQPSEAVLPADTSGVRAWG